MNLNNLTSKITKNADKLGMLVGAYGYLQESGAGAGLNAFENAERLIQDLISQPHFPDLNNLVRDLTVGNTFKTAVKAALIGYVLKEINLHPQLTKIGKALTNGGIGAAKGAAIVTTIAYSSTFHSPRIRDTGNGGHSSGGNSETWRYPN